MDVTLRIRGDQLGSFAGFSATGNSPNRVLTLDDVTAEGTASDTYTVLVEQVNTGVNEFQNGQFVTIFDSAGNEVVARTSIQPDREQGLGGGDEHLVLFDAGYVIDLGGVPATPTDVDYTDADENAVVGEGDDDGELDFAAFPCLATGTRIATPSGLRRVEDLCAGMQVLDGHGGVRTVLWSGQRTLPLGPATADQRPVCFTTGSLGPGLPQRDLVVSPGHRMYLAGALPAQLFGKAEVLAVARGLAGLPGVHLQRDLSEVTYVTVLLDRHAVLQAEGVLTESFYPGPYGMRTLGREMRKAVADRIPGYATKGYVAYGEPAHRLLRLQEARRLVRKQNTALQKQGLGAWKALQVTSLQRA